MTYACETGVRFSLVKFSKHGNVSTRRIHGSTGHVSHGNVVMEGLVNFKLSQFTCLEILDSERSERNPLVLQSCVCVYIENYFGERPI